MAPKANCYVERLIGSLRRECLDHLLIVSEAHLQKVLDEYCDFLNEARPHQGIGQRRPATSESSALAPRSALDCGTVVARPVLGGLTCKFRKVSFLNFLLSGEQDIDRYDQMRSKGGEASLPSVELHPSGARLRRPSRRQTWDRECLRNGKGP
jgi:hypothetical protein